MLGEAAKRRARARFASLGAAGTTDSHNVVGVVPGQTDEYILVTCHHDAPFASAVEDASGLSVLLALAEAFGATPGRLRRGILFAASSGHFHGGIGNRVFVERHRDGLLAKTVAALGVEHVGEEAEADGRGGYRLTGRPEVRAIFAEQSPALLRVLEEEADRAGLDRAICTDAYPLRPRAAVRQRALLHSGHPVGMPYQRPSVSPSTPTTRSTRCALRTSSPSRASSRA